MKQNLRRLIVACLLSTCCLLISCGNANPVYTTKTIEQSIETVSTMASSQSTTEQFQSHAEQTQNSTEQTQSTTEDFPTKKYDSPTIEVESVSAHAGDLIEVSIKLYNNPGVAGALLCIRFDENLTLQKAENKDAFAALDFTEPGKLENLCRFSWDSECGMTTQDGEILTLTFQVALSAHPGESLPVLCSYRPGDIFDEDLIDVNFEMMPGYVSVVK